MSGLPLHPTLLLRDIAARLRQAGIASPDAEARLIMEHVTGSHPLMLGSITDDEKVEIERILARRLTREPLQHILGVMWFRRLTLNCRPGVFIVRPETEVVVDAALAHLRRMAAECTHVNSAEVACAAVGRAPEQGRRALRVVDACTGSGAIAAALLSEWDHPTVSLEILAFDLNPVAVQLAHDNCAAVLGQVPLTHAASISVIECDARDPWLEPWGQGQCDLVVSNPPYVPAGVCEDPETCHDPDLALYGGGQRGLDFPAALIRRVHNALVSGGVLIMEHDSTQGDELKKIASECGYREVSTGVDLTGRDRYLTAIKS